MENVNKEEDVQKVSEPSEVIIDDTPEATSTVVEELVFEKDIVEEHVGTVLQEYKYSEAIKEKTDEESISLPPDTSKNTVDVLRRAPNIDMTDSEEARRWAASVGEGLEYVTFNDVFEDTLKEKGADFRQAIQQSGSVLAGGVPKLKEIQNQNLKGERGVMRLMSHLGMGTLFQAPLWHTGIWVTLKAPTETEIVELNRILISDKIKFGRYSYGLAFSNTTAYTIDRLVDFALSHVYDTTVNSDEVPVEKLRDIIAVQDIPTLIWGLVATMYPRGFKYNRACINDPEKCNFVLEERLAISKLLWVNNNALTEWQKTHMTSRRANSKDLASVVRYKDELLKTQKRKVKISRPNETDTEITLKSPTINEYIDSGHRWIGDIVNLVEKSLNIDASDNERENYIKRHGQATAMRQYVHWVDSVEFDSNQIDDKETIENVFNVLSSEDKIRNAFIDEVIKYINESTIAVIGIPVYDCPQCGMTQEMEEPLPKHKNVIPLDVNQVFFSLHVQKLERLKER